MCIPAQRRGSFDLTIQRQLTNRFFWKWLHRRRITHEYQPVNINAVPYMMTMGGQSFDKPMPHRQGLGLRHILCRLRREYAIHGTRCHRVCQHLRGATIL